jgi:hypothetical protein
VFNLLWREKRILNLDGFRRKMEEFSPHDYARLGLYAPARRRPCSAGGEGRAVRCRGGGPRPAGAAGRARWSRELSRASRSATACGFSTGKPGHVRTPSYVCGRVGTIERYCGLFENPEERLRP